MVKLHTFIGLLVTLYVPFMHRP